MALPLVSVILTARLTRLLVNGAPASEADERVLTILVVQLAIVFVGLQLSTHVSAGLSQYLGRRVREHVADRVMQAVAAPVRLAPIEEPEARQSITAAAGAGGAYNPIDAVVGGVALLTTRLRGLLALLLVGLISVPTAVAAAIAWMAVRALISTDATKRSIASLTLMPLPSRAGYYCDMAVGRAGAAEIKTLGLAGWLRKRHEAASVAGLDAGTAARLAMARRAALLVIVVTTALTVPALLALTDVARGAMGISALVIVLLALVLTADLARVDTATLNYQQGADALKPAMALPRLLPQEPKPASTTKISRALDFQERISFEDVGFSYPWTEAEVLVGLDLTFMRGHTTALVGANGEGKTTIIKLLLGLYEPTRGAINIDGRGLCGLDIVEWRRRVSVLFQDFLHYPSTLETNITFGANGGTLSAIQLQEIAKRTGVDNIAAGLPGTWQSLLASQGSPGAELSGGQWQRVALARALAGLAAGRDILVLDEPTAHLDLQGEQSLYDSLDVLAPETTKVIVSHRFPTVRRADSIYVIHGGRVIESGNHSQLLAVSGVYAEMYRAQASLSE